jgi:O-antigen/teichoic acid export membrane protein
MTELESDSASVATLLEPVSATADQEASVTARTKSSSRLLHMLALSDQAIVSGSNFLTSMVLARGLSLAEFGRYSLLWMAVLFGSNIQMSLIIAPMMSIGPIQRLIGDKSFVGSILTFQLIFAAGLTALFAIGIGALHLTGNSIDASWVIPILLANIAFQLQDFTRRAFFYQKRLIAAVASDCISYLGQLGVIGIFFLKLHRLSVSNVLWINAITSLAAILFALPMVPLPIFRVKVLRSILRRNWQSARYLLAATVMQWTSGNFFVLIAPLFMGVSAVGAMRACQSIMNTTNIWMQGLENSLPSEASRIMMKSGVTGLKRYILRALAMLGGLTALIVIVINVAPEFWLKIIYGPHLKGYGFVLRAFGIISLLTVLTLPLRAGLRSIEKTRPIFIGYITTTIYSAVSAPLLGKFFGLPGILLGIIGTQLLLVPILSISLRRNLSHENIR